MVTTDVSAFDSTVHLTNIWLNDVMDQLGWHDKHRAYRALRVVLHTLRDRLTVEQAVALGAQLPTLVRGFYYEGWHPHGKPVKERKKEQFLAHIEAAFTDEPIANPEAITHAVFHVIAKHVTAGEVEHLKINLPAEIRSLWMPESESLWF